MLMLIKYNLLHLSQLIIRISTTTRFFVTSFYIVACLKNYYYTSKSKPVSAPAATVCHCLIAAAAAAVVVHYYGQQLLLNRWLFTPYRPQHRTLAAAACVTSGVCMNFGLGSEGKLNW